MPVRPTRQRQDSSAGPVITSEDAPAPAPESAPAEPGRQSRRAHLPKAQGDTTRITVDVSTRVAADLKMTALGLRDELPGGPHVAVGQVMAALAALVHEDVNTRDRVVAYLRNRVVQ